MKTAFYHQSGKQPVKLIILKENEDGTVDLGLSNGRVIVSECAITDDPEAGSCTLPSDSETKADARAAAKELRQKAHELGKAASAAVKAAKAAEGKANHAELLQAAETAAATAKQADADADEAEAAAK